MDQSDTKGVGITVPYLYERCRRRRRSIVMVILAAGKHAHGPWSPGQPASGRARRGMQCATHILVDLHLVGRRALLLMERRVSWP